MNRAPGIITLKRLSPMCDVIRPVYRKAIAKDDHCYKGIQNQESPNKLPFIGRATNTQKTKTIWRTRTSTQALACLSVGTNVCTGGSV